MIHYVTRGAGPVCLVISGIGTKPYERQMPAALDRHLRMVFVALRGEPTFASLAEDLDEARKQLGAERAIILGHSITGALALEVARLGPGWVSHVMMVGTPPDGDMTTLAACSQVFFQERASDERKHLLAENMMNAPQSLWSQTPMRFHDPRFDVEPLFEGADFRPELLEHVMSTLVAGWRAQPVAAPVLVCLGRDDFVVPFTLWEGVTWPRVEIFERSGHQPFVEEPERFVEVVTGWLGVA